MRVTSKRFVSWSTFASLVESLPVIVARNETAFVLTGAPGVGKTSLLQELMKRSYRCVPEPARIVLAEQRARQGEAVPEKNAKAFCDSLLQRSVEDYERYKGSKELTVFDRGVPDNIAYASGFNLDTNPFRRAAEKYTYSKKVFLLLPWEAIYKTDDERKMSFQQVCEFHSSVSKAYSDLDYELIEVPQTSIEERANFVIASLPL